MIFSFQYSQSWIEAPETSANDDLQAPTDDEDSGDAVFIFFRFLLYGKYL